MLRNQSVKKKQETPGTKKKRKEKKKTTRSKFGERLVVGKMAWCLAVEGRFQVVVVVCRTVKSGGRKSDKRLKVRTACGRGEIKSSQWMETAQKHERGIRREREEFLAKKRKERATSHGSHAR